MASPFTNMVDPRPETGARFQAPDFTAGADAIARGAGRLAQGVSDAAEGIDKIGEMYDTAAVKQADAEDLKRIAEIRARVLETPGLEAQNAIKEAREQIIAIRKERMAGLHGARQQRMYADVFDQRNLQIEESFTTHSMREIQKAEKASAIARGEQYLDMAVDTFGTNAFDANLDTALGEVSAANRGMSADFIGRAQAKVRSQVYSRVISTMLADPEQTQQARLALEAHAADILPDEEEKLRRQLNPLLEEDQTEADAGWAFTNAPTPEGEEPAAPTEGPDTQPRSTVETSQDAPPTATRKPVSPDDPLRGKGRVTNTAAQHRGRGSGNALDIAAKEGTPIYPPMSGKVIKNWWSEEGGWSVLVEHPNGYVTGYAHMRSRSALREGQEVDADTAIGGVGTTGTKSTGPHVHYTVRQSRTGPKVDPAALDWGDTIDPKSVSWKEPDLVKFEAEENMLGRALDRLHKRATNENWSNRRYQRAIDRVRQISGVQEQLYRQQTEERYQSALATVVKLGDGFTNVSQIPGYGLLEPGQMMALENIAKGNRQPAGDGKPEAGSIDYLDIMRVSYQERDRFIKEGPKLLNNPNITSGERARLYERWLDLTSDPNGKLAGDMDEAVKFANRFLPKDFPQDRRAKFMDAYEGAITRRQRELGKPLTDAEKMETARALVVSGVRYQNGQEVGDGFIFENVGQRGTKTQVDIPQVFNTIPVARRSQIIEQLRAAGRSHSMRDVVSVYLQAAR